MVGRLRSLLGEGGGESNNLIDLVFPTQLVEVVIQDGIWVSVKSEYTILRAVATVEPEVISSILGVGML